MDFDSLVGTMDDIVTSTFEKVDPVKGTPLEVTLHLNDGSDVTVPCVVKNPVMEEDYMPGSPNNGTSMLILFIPASAGIEGLRGNTATYGGVDYDIGQCDVDRCGGTHIRMRARTQPYNT